MDSGFARDWFIVSRETFNVLCSVFYVLLDIRLWRHGGGELFHVKHFGLLLGNMGRECFVLAWGDRVIWVGRAAGVYVIGRYNRKSWIPPPAAFVLLSFGRVLFDFVGVCG